MISITQKGQNKNVGFPTFLYCLFPTLLFYPLHTGQETAELKASLEAIRPADSDLIEKIDGHLLDLQKEKTKDREAAKEVPGSNEIRADVGTNVGRNVGANADRSKKSIYAELKAPETI